MKLVSLRIQHRNPKLDKTYRANHQSFGSPTNTSGEIHTYAELRQKIHDDLRVQHPEWIEADGESPMCDSYEARLMQVLNNMRQRASKKSIVDPHRLLEQGAH